jgi:fumarylacetoacetase
MTLDDTHDPGLSCWIDSARGHADFPIQNLPLGRFCAADGRARTGVAIGDEVLDLERVLALDLLTAEAAAAAALALGAPLSLQASQRRALRRGLSRLLCTADSDRARRHAPDLLHARSGVRMLLPSAVQGFTDFQAGIHHTLNGRRLRGAGSGSLPTNYHQVPIAYNGRASSVVVSGTPVRRPHGQIKDAQGVAYRPTRQLDIELELGIWVSHGNRLGDAIDIDEADEHIGGYGLVNDWSARDLMAWEMDRLGPFTGKSFATTVSAWLISPEALAPFRGPAYVRAPEPGLQPPPHLRSDLQQARGGLNVGLQVRVATARQQQAGQCPSLVAESHTRHLYWTPAQMLTHHTSSGCNLLCGDLLGTGTISGPQAGEEGSFKELGAGGERPFAVGDEQRCWAEDGDLVVLLARASASAIVQARCCLRAERPVAELFRCTAEPPPAAAGRPSVRAAARHAAVVDIHCHVLCTRAEQLATQLGVTGEAGTMRFASDASRQAAQALRQAIRLPLTDIDTRLADMDRAGIDLQVLSPAPNQYHYEAEPEAGRQLSAQVNTTIAEMAQRASGRFVGLGTVPLQHPGLAIEALRHAVNDLGLRGVEIGTHVAGQDLDTLGLEDFFAEAQALNALVFLHPAGFSEGRRLGQFFLNNIIGNPLESTLAVSRLVFSGLFERLPGLTMCVAHGGGYLAAYPGRMDQAWRVRPECRACLQAAPSQSLKRLYFDTLVHSPQQLQHLVQVYGTDHLLLGSDYPYDMGDPDARVHIETLPDLDEAGRRAMLGGNALRLLQMDPETLAREL